MTTRELIIKHEDKKLYPYKDTVGKLTIGVGHNLDDNGISNATAEFILAEDINTAEDELVDVFPKFDTYPDEVKMVMTDMMFNMGYHRFVGFKKMIKAVKAGDYKLASVEARDSKWCKQVGSRCKENCSILESVV